ncbi:MAG: guanylate kinase [Parachlamydiaceae bacterium]|nr:guanylate kinase [Parachlamydiaceae bacterium]
MPQKLLSESHRGRAFIVSAPAGTGKTTLVQMLVQEFPSVIESISYTTRNPRLGEIDGVHYNFISAEEFQKRIASGDFLEYVSLYGCYYGTSKLWVEAQLALGKHVVLVIDTQGALQLKGSYPATYIFVGPPSIEELRRRLIKRGTETMEKIDERINIAEKELQAARFYDYFVINRDLNIAYQVLRSILIAEDHRVDTGL